MHLLHLLPHRLHLLLCSLQGRVVFSIAHQLRIDGLGKPFRHFLRPRPVHVLDKQVASHRPQLRVALQQLGHSFQRLLALGRVAWAGRSNHIVLADAKVVDFLNHNAFLVNDLVNRLLLIWVDANHLGVAVLANDPSHALRVVNLGNQVNQLAGNVSHAAGQIVAKVVCADIAFALPSQDSLA